MQSAMRQIPARSTERITSYCYYGYYHDQHHHRHCYYCLQRPYSVNTSSVNHKTSTSCEFYSACIVDSEDTLRCSLINDKRKKTTKRADSKVQQGTARYSIGTARYVVPPASPRSPFGPGKPGRPGRPLWPRINRATTTHVTWLTDWRERGWQWTVQQCNYLDTNHHTSDSTWLYSLPSVSGQATTCQLNGVRSRYVSRCFILNSLDRSRVAAKCYSSGRLTSSDGFLVAPLLSNRKDLLILFLGNLKVNGRAHKLSTYASLV